jgi:hypothetical protein
MCSYKVYMWKEEERGKEEKQIRGEKRNKEHTWIVAKSWWFVHTPRKGREKGERREMRERAERRGREREEREERGEREEREEREERDESTQCTHYSHTQPYKPHTRKPMPSHTRAR